MAILLSRDDFREGVLARDGHKCVICGEPAVDAHHIIERRLFPDGGYYIENGASVCEKHHLQCEMTLITVERVRDACGILKPVLPPHLYDDQIYDKWGNIVMPNGNRLKGELFFDESVQKILKRGQMLDMFTDYVKYPRTFHLPWSPGLHDDDRMMPNIDAMVGKEVVIMEKLDGENTTMYCDHIHARSVDSDNHESRTWAKNLWSSFAFDIPKGWRICAENMFAEHSISYTDLESYLYGFSVWNERNECLSWDESLEWFDLLGITVCPVVYRGNFDRRAIDEATSHITSNPEKHEGYVIRIADSFPMSQFRFVVGKYVRADHIQTVKHWMHGQRVVRNKLK